MNEPAHGAVLRLIGELDVGAQFASLLFNVTALAPPVAGFSCWEMRQNVGSVRLMSAVS
jgi:hypothetical protein